jgi:(p)ppGpp synthase/HD superfamily hydrolase
MKRFLASLTFAAASLMAAVPAGAASAAQEQAFVASYKAAFEAQDAAALQAMLHAEGAHPMALEFYQMMMTAEFGATVTSIGLQDLTPEDMAKAEEVQPAPDGSNVVLMPKPYKKLVIKLATKTADMESTSESSAFVAEKDGKLGIAVPAPAE